MHEDKARLAAVSATLAKLSELVDPQPRGETIAQAADEYLASKAGLHKPKTEANREYYLGRFCALFGETPLSDLQSRDTTLWIDQLPAGSRHNARTVISPFLNWAAANGWPHAGGAHPVVVKHGSEERDRFLSPKEFARVAQALAEYANEPRSREVTVDVLWVCLLTALRSGEVVTLKRSEISPTGDFLNLRNTKTGDRKVHVGPQVQSIIRKWRSRGVGSREWLFPGRVPGYHVQQSSISHRWRAIANSIGLHDVNLHDLRRTWTSLALRSGEQMAALRVCLGHTTEHMTARYAHLGPDFMGNVASRVERTLLGNLAYQLELALPDREESGLDDLTDAQRSLVMLPGTDVMPTGAGLTQAAQALVRRAVFHRCGPRRYVRTPLGERLRKEGSSDV
ncbi:MAG: tyrosine-type recombinase/integrase [Nannocystaceae bacterium]|nr:site-specific integrase [bacterium]